MEEGKLRADEMTEVCLEGYQGLSEFNHRSYGEGTPPEKVNSGSPDLLSGCPRHPQLLAVNCLTLHTKLCAVFSKGH